jgi:hypothetical protein
LAKPCLIHEGRTWQRLNADNGEAARAFERRRHVV